jgi:hypothetical protein
MGTASLYAHYFRTKSRAMGTHRLAGRMPNAASYLYTRSAGHGSCNEDSICTAIWGWKFGFISLLPVGYLGQSMCNVGRGRLAEFCHFGPVHADGVGLPRTGCISKKAFLALPGFR